ncbi:hypothetical protein M3226_05930 [Neobacillus cucumis]|uniref:hypothetical protein n=1 Tax=Neobacillus cucumis TaxID=1740721 RepID=UPI00203F33DB|nr:hypothetical protein [Neobacillus cucumis]MCM3725240.1 hypothetical protein [Neobacillus cucumis]
MLAKKDPDSFIGVRSFFARVLLFGGINGNMGGINEKMCGIIPIWSGIKAGFGGITSKTDGIPQYGLSLRYKR